MNVFEHEEEGDFNKPLILIMIENINYQLKYILIKSYLKGIINNLKKSDTCKIQWTIAINFSSSKGNDEEHVMNSEHDNKEIIINEKPDKVIKNYLIHSLVDIKIFWKNQWNLVVLSLIMIIYCIINVTQKIQIVVDLI